MDAQIHPKAIEYERRQYYILKSISELASWTDFDNSYLKYSKKSPGINIL